jgi:hypothetical protein
MVVNMALLDSLFGETPSYYGGLLGENELKRLQGQASNQSQMTLANALLRAGAPSRTPGGGALAISEGLQMGQQAYKQALAQGLQEKMQGLQVQDMIRKRNESEQMRKLFPQIFKMESTPDQQIEVSPEKLMMYGQPTQGVVRDDEGNMMPGGSIVPAQMQTIPGARTMSVDTNKLQALAAMSSDPLATYASLAKLVPDLRKAGFIGAGAQGENPFNIFVNDPSIPVNFRNAAAQYQKSYASGQLDPEKADERVRQLAQSIQSAQDRAATEARMNQQFEQSQAALAESRRQTGVLAQQGLDLRKAAEANKPETFSYSQKKDFDTIAASRDEAKKAESNASLAVRAAPLLSQAYGGVFEAGIKGVAGAVGIGSEAKDANDRLATISQTLAVQAPKFGGPTSDADAKRYDKAVGDLANPKVSIVAKQQALKDIDYLGKKARAYADQSENFFYQNNKSLRGFQFTPPPDPLAAQNAPY